MKFSYAWLKELSGIKESPEKLAEFLTLRAFEVESVARKGRDRALDIKLFPNRSADASGHIGMAREIASLHNRALRYRKPRISEIAERTADALRVRIARPADCPRYTARVMRGVALKPSPKWLRERLEICGIQSINNLVDAANYVMLEHGQPLHVFDYDALGAKRRGIKEIIVRRARQGEALYALDGKRYALSPDVLVIADEKSPVAIAGIKGGKDSGVSPATTTVVLESANFDPVRTRIASSALGLKTDASWRFERGMDPNGTAAAVDRLAELIREVAGGEILSGRVDAYPHRLRPGAIGLRLDYLDRIVGEEIPAAFVSSCLRRLGWKFTARGRDFIVRPPTERRDIRIEEDVIEEIVRLWGYGNIRAVPPRIPLAPAEAGEARRWERHVRELLAGAGFTEVYPYSFVGKNALGAFGASSASLLELENPTSPETRFLAAHPAQQLLGYGSENARRFERVSIFGIAAGFKPSARPSPKNPAEETTYLVIVRAARDTRAATGGESFYAVKGALEHLFDSLGITDHWYDDALGDAERRKAVALHPYRTAKVMAGDRFLGIVAELHPDAQQRLKSKARLVFAQIDFGKLWKLARADAEFQPIGKYPAIIRDLAVVAPETARMTDVENVIENAAGGLLTDADLFDEYRDEILARRGGRSLAFRLVFQSPKRTLTDGEVNRLLHKVRAAVTSRGWEMR